MYTWLLLNVIYERVCKFPCCNLPPRQSFLFPSDSHGEHFAIVSLLPTTLRLSTRSQSARLGCSPIPLARTALSPSHHAAELWSSQMPFRQPETVIAPVFHSAAAALQQPSQRLISDELQLSLVERFLLVWCSAQVRTSEESTTYRWCRQPSAIPECFPTGPRDSTGKKGACQSSLKVPT
jgi:hypothetical protein